MCVVQRSFRSLGWVREADVIDKENDVLLLDFLLHSLFLSEVAPRGVPLRILCLPSWFILSPVGKERLRQGGRWSKVWKHDTAC